MTVAIIIAKRNSSRLPGKNRADVCGMPLVGWSILQARCSQSIDRTVVSTDDDKIWELADGMGAELVRRPEWMNAADYTAYVQVKHALDTIGAEGAYPEAFLCVLPTSPLRLPWDFDEALAVLGPEGHVQPITYQREINVYRWVSPRLCVLEQQSTKWKLADQGGGFSVWNTEHWLRQSEGQPLTEVAYQAGAYQGTRGSLPTWQESPERVVYPMRPWQRADVDDADDLDEVRALLHRHIMSRGGTAWYEDYARGNVETERWMPSAS